MLKGYKIEGFIPLRLGLHSLQDNTELAISEILLVTGFFFIAALEVIVHRFVPHKTGQPPNRNISTANRNHDHNGNHNVLQVRPAASSQQVELRTVTLKSEAGEDVAVIGGADATSASEKAALRRAEDRFLSAVRTFFVVFALSFHAVMDGIALSLQEDTSAVWISFGAISLHKFVIAFSIGVELISAGVFVFSPQKLAENCLALPRS